MKETFISTTDVINTLGSVVYALNSVEVKGIRNMEALGGSIRQIEALANLFQKEKQAQDAETKEEVPETEKQA